VSFGFWFGDDALPEPAFYSYTAPEPAGLAEEPLLRPAAWVDRGSSHLAVLRYDDVRAQAQPKQAVLDFFESAYRAGARLAGWDIATLACPSGITDPLLLGKVPTPMRRFEAFTTKWIISEERAVRCLAEKVERALTFYDFPQDDWPKIRTNNVAERAFRFVRQSQRPMGAFTNEQSAEWIFGALGGEWNRRRSHPLEAIYTT
jgi:hypothetical protein